MNNKTIRKRSLAALLAAASLAALRRRARRPPTTTRSSFPRSIGATSRSRSSRPTTSRSACSPAATRPRTSARAGSTAPRIGYHITEDFFVEGVLRPDQGQRRAVPPDPAGRHLPAGHGEARLLQPVDRLQPVPRRDLHRRQARPAVAVLPRRRRRQHQVRRPAQADLQRRLRLPRLSRRLGALQLDLRDHIFSLDLLGKRQSTQNLELTGGLTFYF